MACNTLKPTILLTICYDFVTLIFMAVKTKKRINISVSADINRILVQLAKRDDIPVAKKTLELIKQALELEEDIVLDAIASERDTKNVRHFSDEEAWR